MGECLTSMYQKDFIQYSGFKRPHLEIPVNIYENTQTKDQYIEAVDNNESEWNTEADKLIRKLYHDRMQSCYRVSYCREMLEESTTKTKGRLATAKKEPPKNEDILITYFGEMYHLPKSQKLLPPLPTSCRLFGYSRPSFMYTQWSEYQATICKAAYDLFKRDFDRGVDRLGSRRPKPPAFLAKLTM